MTMSEPSPQPAWRQMELPLTSYAADFHASPTASPDSAAEAATSATSGPNSPGSFARLGPNGCWLRMCQGYCQLNLDGSSEEYCETWPAQGTMRNGSAYPLPTWAPRTSASASGLWGTPLSVNRSRTPETMEKCLSFRERSGRTSVPLYLEEQVRLWPTPQARDHRMGMTSRVGDPARHGGWNLPDWIAMWPTPTIDGNYNRKGASAKSGDGLATAVAMWPTPTGQDASNNAGNSQYERNSLPLNAVGGALNPTWVEWLMGYPSGWTDLEA